MSATLGTLWSRRLQNVATSSIYTMSVTLDLNFSIPYTLLKRFNVFFTDSDTSDTSEMPSGLSRQVLDHNASEYGNFSLNVIQNTVI